ncbi:GNAT family N-acetyltransferase [Sneathiella marina]|uniref:GNAT family N-acetyltransferase n=1 Tax=Sneathiella marina TaxID=2950108 RepID=A0ABY4W6Q0_9PROT|nr:GNAT family N-acetyltransferase [Sneathiella marina]USG61405.1 GNAT family N-acetyltransferase [Sneathiella marina]
MTIRRACKADEESIRACAEDAYEKYISAIGKKPAPMIADFGLQISEGIVHVAENLRGEVDGFIVFFPRKDHMFLENVAVKGSAVGRGVGKRLMAFCEAEARRLDLGSIRLYTNEKMTENLAIYPHLGFSETDRREEEGFRRVFFEKVLE